MNLNERPEGATHYQPDTCKFAERWFDFSNPGAPRVFYPNGWAPSSVKLEDEPSSRFVVLPWNGECSLQAGMKCEYSLTNGGVWHDCTVKYVLANGKQLVAECAGNPDGEAVLHVNTCQFRPLRTPEQIKAEKEISDMIDDAMDGHMCLTEAEAKIVCTQLHKAGYRMQVTP